MSNPNCGQKYNDDVPVVFIDGRKAFKYRIGRASVSECVGSERVKRKTLRGENGSSGERGASSGSQGRGRMRDRDLAPEGYTLISQAES